MARAAVVFQKLARRLIHQSRLKDQDRRQHRFRSKLQNMVFELLEPRLLLSAAPFHTAALAQAGMDLTFRLENESGPVTQQRIDNALDTVESEVVKRDAFAGQVIYLDVDGARNVTYDGPITVSGIDVPVFKAPDSLAGQENEIIASVLGDPTAPSQGPAWSSPWSSRRLKVHIPKFTSGGMALPSLHALFLGLSESRLRNRDSKRRCLHLQRHHWGVPEPPRHGVDPFRRLSPITDATLLATSRMRSGTCSASNTRTRCTPTIPKMSLRRSPSNPTRMSRSRRTSAAAGVR